MGFEYTLQSKVRLYKIHAEDKLRYLIRDERTRAELFRRSWLSTHLC